MHQIPVGILVILGLFATNTVGAADEWKVLFNGKDLTGWRPVLGDGSFTVAGSVIRARAETKKLNHLFYVGDLEEGVARFKNFELELWARSEPNSNSGVYFHSDMAIRNQGRMFLRNGYEVQLNSTEKEKRKTGSLYRVVDLDTSVVDESQWFRINISVVEKRITVKINGDEIVDYTEPANPERVSNHEGRVLNPEGGGIALQAHDPESVFYFKDIRIRSLP